MTAHVTIAAPIPQTCSHVLGPWRAGAPVPTPHNENVIGVVNDRIFLIGGFTDGALNTTTQVSVYNPATDTWEHIANPRTPAPISVSHAAFAVDGQYIWMIGGFEGQHPAPPTDEVWRYDTLNDLWTPGPDLPSPRASGAATIIGRNLHVIAGLQGDRQTDINDHIVLDLDNPVAWTAAAPVIDPHNHLNALTINNQLYAVGGQYGHDGPGLVADDDTLYRYDPATNAWAPLRDMPTPRSHAEMGTFIYDDRIIVTGGRNSSAQSSIFQYDPAADAWITLGRLPLPRSSIAARVINGQFIALGGFFPNTNSAQIDTWIADITTVCSAPPLPVGAGTGLTGEYFDDPTLATSMLTRIDPQINFQWNAGSPAAGIASDNYSVRWTGQIEPRTTGHYVFTTLSDDAARLWVDGQLIIDDWISHGPQERRGEIFLNAGRHNIQIEYFETTGSSTMELYWESFAQPRQLVPQSQLYPNPGPAPAPPVNNQQANQSQQVTAFDPFVTKTAAPPFAIPGEAVTFTFVVTNPGASPAVNIQAVDPLPPQVEILSVATTAGTTSVNGQNVTAAIPVLQPGQSATITIQTRIRSSVAAPFIITNEVCLTAPVAVCDSASVISVSTLPATGESRHKRRFTFEK